MYCTSQARAGQTLQQFVKQWLNAIEECPTVWRCSLPCPAHSSANKVLRQLEVYFIELST